MLMRLFPRLPHMKAVANDSANYNKTPKEMLQIIRSNVAADPFIDDGYLKLATLEACELAGLLDCKNTGLA